MHTANTILLGRGLDIEGDQAYLSPDSLSRVEHLARDYFTLQKQYDDGGLIVVSGGRPRYAGEELGVSEAGLAIDWLMSAGVPGRLIEKEDESTDTFENWLYSAPFFDDRGLSQENPLKVITNPDQWIRARFAGHMVMGGNVSFVPSFAVGGGGIRRTVQEFALDTIWRMGMTGIEPGDREAVWTRKRQVDAHFFDPLRSVLTRLDKK